MPLYLGSKTVSENINMGDTVIQNTFDLFDVKWSDHIINNESWMCADDFNWIDGSVFSAAWNELKSEWDLATVDSTPAQQDVIGDITINYWKSPKGYKLVEYGGDTPETNENLLQQLYDEVGIAWYYLIDTTGQIRFKLPRTKYGFVGVRSGAGNFVDESLPNITGSLTNGGTGFKSTQLSTNGCIVVGESLNSSISTASATSYNVNIDASRSSPIYQDGANVQQKSTEMHLYFYLADFVRTPLESNLNTFITETKETLNEKVNVSDYSADKTLIENDIDTLDDSTARLATDNTFTGMNTFERGAVFIKNVNIDRDVNPSATQYASWLIQDKNGKQICNFYVSQNTTGTVTASMIATGRDGVDARISVSRNVNGTTMSYAPTPPTSDNSTQIATTAWVNKKHQVVSTLPVNPDPDTFYYIPEE